MTKKYSTKELLAWALYDFANSSYFIVILTFVFSTYFSKKIANDEILGTTLWGYTISASALLIAILSPIFGTMADHSGHHKTWLFGCTYLGILTTALLWFAYPSLSSIPLVLICVFISNFALELSSVFYNAFLPKIAPPDHLGRISGWGWACGYFGGILCLLIALYLAESLTKDNAENIRSISILVSLWMLIFSLPLFVFVPNPRHNSNLNFAILKKGILDLFVIIKNLSKRPNLFLFLLARILYMDGLNTVFSLGGIYAAGTFKLNINEIILFGIIMNFTAGLGALIFAWVDDWIGSKKTILLAMVFFMLVYSFILVISSQWLFWLSAPFLGLFVGPIQSSSRSFLARIAHPKEITQMYGLYSLSGKITSFLGPLLVAFSTYFFANQRIGMAIILLFFFFGGGLLFWVKEAQ